MWANEPKMARKWTDEHGSTPVKAKKGKYEEFKHPQHDITPIEHMEEKVSSKERVERLLNERKKKKLVTAQEGQLIREKTRGTGAAVKGTDHYVMQGMDAAQEGKLIQVPTRGTGQAVKGTDHYVMQGMDAAKHGKYIKAKHGDFVPVANPHVDVAKYIDRLTKKEDKPESGRSRIKGSEEKVIKKKKKSHGPKGGAPKAPKVEDKVTKWDQAKGGQGFTPGWKPHLSVRTAKKGKYLTTDLKGYDVKKVSSKTSDKFMKLFKHRETGGFKKAKDYKKYLTSLGKMTTKAKAVPLPSSAKFLQRRLTLGSARTLLGKTTIGKVALAGAVGYAGVKALKKKWSNVWTKKKEILPKKKPIKKSIGGETVVMKSGGGYIEDLL
jgi:uncharacterized Zn-binding protein involved in type VI secretion